MTTTPPEAPTGPAAGGDGAPHEGPRVTRDDVRDLGRLRRTVHDRKVAGVAGGLARHLDIDPLVLRVAFVVLAFFGGAGLLVYGACWLLVPEEGSDEAPVTLDERSRTVALLVVGVLAVFALVGDSWGVFWFPWPLAIIALVALVILTRKDKRHGSRPPSYGPAPTPAGQEGETPASPYTHTYEYGQHQTGWAGPGTYAAPTTWSATKPRKRGPVLFWATLALIALGCGILGIADVAGAGVTDSAYGALTVATIGVMLVVGSFWGRAGGLILLGLVATAGLFVSTAADNWETERIRATPATADELDSRYELGNGDLQLDLTQVSDLEELDGRRISVEGGVGELEVVVPDGIDLNVEAEVGGPGAVDFFGEESGGFTTRVVRSRDDGDIDLFVDAQLGLGQITFREE